jgi:regulator of replication initiation timing
LSLRPAQQYRETSPQKTKNKNKNKTKSKDKTKSYKELYMNSKHMANSTYVNRQEHRNMLLSMAGLLKS